MDRRTVLAGLALLGATASVRAQNIRFFRIGTGGVAGTYYPIGGLIADIISNPPGARPCEKGGSCGVPGLVAIAQSSNGSVANVEAVASGALESAFVQSDVAYWAYTGTEIFADQPAAETLRAIANLYQESLHVVVRKGAGIRSIPDLAGKRVSLDEPGSGTLVDSRIVLHAFGLTEDDLEVEYIKPSPAVARIIEGTLDAFFIVAGYPTGSVAELAERGAAELVALRGPEIDAVLEAYSFFTEDVIPFGTYRSIPTTRTISVGAQWLVSSEVDDDLVYGITQALWHDNARQLLDNGHAKGRAITRATALQSLGVPLHPGAERYYREQGMID